MRSVLGGLVGVNSASLKVTGGRRNMHSTIGGMKVHDTETADQYEAEHPAVRTHPDTGRKALYVSRSHTIRFKDMSEEESRPLIEFLQAHQTCPSSPAVRWAPGTLTVWDTAARSITPSTTTGQRRRMRRRPGAQTPATLSAAPAFKGN
jgi:taurine dioxygenase